MEVKKRDSNLELYRIVLMLLIIAHHYVVNSGLLDLVYSKPITINSLFLSIFGAWGKIGINCFILITGYFMCDKTITLKKFLKLLLEVLFYNLVISGLFLVFGYNGFSINNFLKSFILLDGISNNFTNCFLVFYLLIPFINVLINNLKQKQHLILIIVLLSIYTVIALIPKIVITLNYVTWFSIIYIIGSYLKKYVPDMKNNWSLYLYVSIFLSIFSVIVGLYLSHKVDKKLIYYMVNDSNKLFAVTTSICLFMQFKNMKIKYNRYINYISSSIFGVLLIHANSDAMRHFLWKTVLNNVSMYDSSLLIMHAVLSVLGIFTICVIIDKIRISFIEKPFFKLFSNKIDCLEKRIKKAVI